MAHSQSREDALVEEAFEEAECVVPNSQHGGETKHAYIVWHGCYAGFICEAHFHGFVDRVRLNIKVAVTVDGAATCATCKKDFDTVDGFAKVYPLQG